MQTQDNQVNRTRATTKFVVTFLIGAFFFLLPVRVEGQWTVPFDVVISSIQELLPRAVALYSLVTILLSVALSVTAELQARERLDFNLLDILYFKTGPVFLVFRILGGVLAIMLFFQVGPEFVLAEETGGLMFNELVAAAGVIVPIGAIFITLFVAFGGLEFIGTLARPLMRPVFNVPGRSALDAIASYVGSYSVGIYVTNKVYNEGRYSAREAAIIATCFSSVSIGFFAVVAATLDLLNVFPLLFLSVTVVCILLAVVLCRIPPLSSKPDSYVTEPKSESDVREGNLFRAAVEAAVERVSQSRGVFVELRDGFVAGYKLILLILPTILSIGMLGLLVAQYTPLFDWLGRPLEPVIALLGIPDAATVAPATLIGITEMYLPALLVTEAAVEAKFFVAVLSLSQMMFFSAVIPLLLSVDIPITVRDCLILFVMRTLLAIPIIAGITHLIY